MSKPLQPVLFISHGSPMVGIEDDAYTEALARWGRDRPVPKAIVVVSAHWETPGAVRVSASQQPRTIHDFGGFPDELYALRYPAPGSPPLAEDIVRRLSSAGIDAVLDPVRGLDHGAWIPLKRLWPEANVPVVQVSMPLRRTPADVARMGAALAPLREDGVLLLGSGGIVHNLRAVNFGDKFAPAEPWATAFDAWVREKLEARDLPGLQAYRSERLGPAAAPTPEHFDPVFFALGAAQPGDALSHVFEGFHHATLSMRSFALGS